MGSGCLSGLILRDAAYRRLLRMRSEQVLILRDAAYGRLLRMRSEQVLIPRSVALATRLEG